MSHKMLFTLLTLLGIVLVSACSSYETSPTPSGNLPNPASVNCEQNGGEFEFRQDSSGGSVGICIFPEGIECEEWAYFRGECLPTGPDLPTSVTTESPTPHANNSTDYQGWWAYTNPTYGFSLLVPPDWVVDETTTGDALMNGHILNVHPQSSSENLNIRLTFRRTGEDILLWPTGVGAGELINEGTLDVAGERAMRVLFVCPTGEINSVWYHQNGNEPNLQRKDLEFGIIISYTGVYCEEGYSLEGKLLRFVEQIISSLKVT
jgi:putative hemolysin